MIRVARILMAMAFPFAVFALTAGAVTAQSYSGSWSATVSRSQHANGTYCIALKDNGSLGWPHSGEATILPESGTTGGTFQVINGLMVVTFSQPGGTGELGALLFTARASNGHIGTGTYEQFYGSEIDSGVLVFGAKNSCSSQ